MNDFDQIMANANSNTTKSNKSFDKNAWRERKQRERQEVYDLYWYFACERQNIFIKKLNY